MRLIKRVSGRVRRKKQTIKAFKREKLFEVVSTLLQPPFYHPTYGFFLTPFQGYSNRILTIPSHAIASRSLTNYTETPPPTRIPARETSREIAARGHQNRARWKLGAMRRCSYDRKSQKCNGIYLRLPVRAFVTLYIVGTHTVPHTGIKRSELKLS